MSRTTIRRLAAAAMAATLAACGTPSVGPGYYRVERGDTVSKIARAHRQSVPSIVRWNNLTNPDAIEVGQVLRVAPPGASSTRPAPGDVRTAPDTASASVGPRASAGTPATPAPSSRIALVWPAQGTTVRHFDGGSSKGIDIANALGTPVIAAASGTVVYAGNGLRGYGNLLIVKHNADYLTAYAHNSKLLVQEGQTVSQGQQIAAMGDSDNDRVALHFELRYKGQSIDPARYLPTR